MNQTRCAIGDMAKVSRSSTGCGCTAAAAEHGVVIYCEAPTLSLFGPAWLLRKPHACHNCGGAIFGYLDADLDPIKPPPLADTTQADESKPVEVEHG